MQRSRDAESLQRAWQRLAARVAGSAERGRPLITVLREDMRQRRLAGGGLVLAVYAAAGLARRQGQAERLRLVDLAAGAACRLPLLPGLGWQCLVLAGEATADGLRLGTLDHHRRPAGPPRIRLSSPAGARLLVRESQLAPGASVDPTTQRAALSAWEQLPGGVGRRQLAHVDAGFTSLQRLAPGSDLPAHTHTQDEECLLLEGELFVEDRLLRAGDYQLAPAGSTHTSITTDSGALLYRHGDGELDRALAGRRRR
jgi:hypothetical protein